MELHLVVIICRTVSKKDWNSTWLCTDELHDEQSKPNLAHIYRLVNISKLAKTGLFWVRGGSHIPFPCCICRASRGCSGSPWQQQPWQVRYLHNGRESPWIMDHRVPLVPPHPPPPPPTTPQPTTPNTPNTRPKHTTQHTTHTPHKTNTHPPTTTHATRQ